MQASQPLPWWVQPGLCVLVLLIFSGALAGSIISGDAGLRNTLCGFAGGGFMTAVGFYFGSSHSSQKKDETIAEAQVALANSTPPPSA